MGNATDDHISPFISPKELATRWRCSRSSVDRIARQAMFSKLCLGRGSNATVRYVVKEVMAYEAARLVALR
jgi:hypothetical protein